MFINNIDNLPSLSNLIYERHAIHADELLYL